MLLDLIKGLGRGRERETGFAYLFEKFPSFSQTFCVREVEAVRGHGVSFPVYSIRRPTSEPTQDMFENAGEVGYLPEKYDEIIASDRGFRQAARKGLEELKELWGSEAEKRRIYEALWLGPRLKKAGVGHVHVHFAGIASRTVFWMKRYFGIGYSVTAHANDIFRDEPPERLTQIFAEARVVVTVSDFSVRYLQEHFPAQREKFVRVYNGIKPEGFAVSGHPAGRPLIVTVGRYIEKKGFGDLIEACALLGGRDFECQIIGHGPLEEEMKAQAERLGLGGRVVVAGPRTEGEIKEMLGRAHLFVLPCINAADGAMDNLPTVIMEAMAAGLPVVSTAVAAVPEMVIDGESGFVVPEKNPGLLAEKMAQLLDDGELRERMGRRGLEHCREVFDVRKTSGALLNTLKTHGAFGNTAKA